MNFTLFLFLSDCRIRRRALIKSLNQIIISFLVFNSRHEVRTHVAKHQTMMRKGIRESRSLWKAYTESNGFDFLIGSSLKEGGGTKRENISLWNTCNKECNEKTRRRKSLSSLLVKPSVEANRNEEKGKESRGWKEDDSEYWCTSWKNMRDGQRGSEGKRWKKGNREPAGRKWGVTRVVKNSQTQLSHHTEKGELEQVSERRKCGEKSNTQSFKWTVVWLTMRM